MKTTKEYYIASVKSQQVKSYNGVVLTGEDEVLWLGEDEGYEQLTKMKSRATAFKLPPKEIYLSRYDGMPWYCRIKPDTFKVYKVTKEVVWEEKVVEEEL